MSQDWFKMIAAPRTRDELIRAEFALQNVLRTLSRGFGQGSLSGAYKARVRREPKKARNPGELRVKSANHDVRASDEFSIVGHLSRTRACEPGGDSTPGRYWAAPDATERRGLVIDPTAQGPSLVEGLNTCVPKWAATQYIWESI